MHHPALLDTTDLLRLHFRLLAGDADAGEALAAALVQTCTRNVRRRLGHVDLAVVQDSIDRAVQSHIAEPCCFDPTKGGLLSFIERSALRNAIDQLRSERARHAREALWAVEWARSHDAGETGNVPQTLRDAWPTLLGTRGALTDHQWALVEPLFSVRLRRRQGRPPRPVRQVLDAVIRMLRLGGWHALPRGHRSSCRRYFHSWCESGLLRDTLDRLEADLCRVKRSHS